MQMKACHAAPAVAPPAVAPSSVAAGPALLVARWGGSVSSGSAAGGVNQGAIRRPYDLRADGSYTHRIESFSFTSSTEVTQILEQGTWSVRGELLTIPLATVAGTVHDKATGQVKQAFAVSLEPVTYRWTLHLFEGLGETQLALRPPAPTARDGAPTTNADFPGSYLLSSRWTPEWMLGPR